MSRRWTPLAGIGAAVAAVNVTAACGLMAAGVITVPTVTPDSAFVPASHTDSANSRPAASSFPAQRVVTAATSAWLPGPWRGEGPATAAATSPFTYPCPDATDLSAPVAAQRRVRIPGFGSATLTAAATPAGYGAATVAGLRESLAACDGRDSTVTAWASQVNSATATATDVSPDHGGAQVSSLIWSRGDVVLTVTAVNRDPRSVAQTWDRAVTGHLTEVCEDLQPKVADTIRTPWRDPEQFRGWLRSSTVSIAKPAVGVTTPPAPAGVEWMPEWVERPAAPEEPIWPANLPTVVERPEEPTRPQPPTLTTDARYRVDDPAGPGCGWAFTGQPVPEFNPDAIQRDRKQVITEVRAELTADAMTWKRREARYREQLADYYADARDYLAYIDDVNRVAAAWQAIRDDRYAYDVAVQERADALAWRSEWRVQRAAAESEYETELERCATATPTPTPTATPGRGNPADNTPDDCPPQRPAILDQSEPWVPPVPTPPRDPRPTWARN